MAKKDSLILVETIHKLYAVMAAAAAQRAMRRIEIGDETDADKWATAAEKWLRKSSANAIRWQYENPRRKRGED